MTVRKARKADLKAICQLSNEINEDHHLHMPHDFVKPDGSNRDEPYWLGFMSMDDSTVFVTEDNGVLTGAVAVSVSTSAPYPFLTSRSRGHVATIVVAESYRGRGLGRELMSAAEAYAKEKGAEDIKLEVMAFNSDALDFYRELGYGNFSFRLFKSLS
ncbi:GNAT family N-acetyltransferase [Halomonas sp. SpR1]|uniref:GNAT family N-acetyltransferase n=1 Tax=Halomonas sp. SpR1 TaxID=3050462 RepID=UPI0027E435CD|nr:GNAT family N-acetyltransferase [Halomonas sp. SpR1]MDQ7734977.1 GNAT family N-acetyltransferase [Halomonas sp. SpR1]